jgi:predicted nucleic acid-binding protein
MKNEKKGWEIRLLSDSPTRIACLVDTDVAIDFLRHRPYAHEVLDQWRKAGLLATSVITHIELFKGMKTKEKTQVALLLDALLPISVDVSIALNAGTIIRENRQKGITTGLADAVIAASALELKVPLLTNNIGHYQILGLKTIRAFNP